MDEYHRIIYNRARNKRKKVLDNLSEKFGLSSFITRHTGLNLEPHNKEYCELPHHINHMSNYGNKGKKIPDKPTVIDGNLFMSCGIEHSNLEKALSIERNNPLVFYSQLEELLEPSYVKLAILPAYDWKFDELNKEGSLGDILIYVEPYGTFAEELEKSLEMSIIQINEQLNKSNVADSPHPLNGKCVGFLGGALGIDEKEKPYFCIDVIQTDGYRYEKGVGNILPVEIKKKYLDGEEGINPWYYEALDSIEKACDKLGIAIAIITLNEAKVRYPDMKGKSSKNMYEDISSRAGYSKPTKITLNFPMHVYSPSKRTMETHIYEI